MQVAAIQSNKLIREVTTKFWGLKRRKKLSPGSLKTNREVPYALDLDGLARIHEGEKQKVPFQEKEASLEG